MHIQPDVFWYVMVVHLYMLKLIVVLTVMSGPDWMLENIMCALRRAQVHACMCTNTCVSENLSLACIIPVISLKYECMQSLCVCIGIMGHGCSLLYLYTLWFISELYYCLIPVQSWFQSITRRAGAFERVICVDSMPLYFKESAALRQRMSITQCCIVC